MPHRLLAIAAALIVLTCTAVVAEDPLALPEGYREWPHVKTMVIVSGHPLYEAFGGMHHVYVNERGLAASRTGGPYPDGSVLVFDLFESSGEGNAYTQGARKVTALMVKDASRYAETGGWGFQAYKPGESAGIVTQPVEQCFGCHAPQKANDYVFSRYE